MKEKYYCPECFSELTEISGCGSVSYFCDKCNCLISKKKIISESDIEKKKVKPE
ncbi:MAG: zinc ribbon domain-containing protein [Bacillota bacterium]|nr:zinc ribbon domain-containing protein [Bacillota bacterium]